MVLRIVKQYERLAKFRFGTFIGMKGPGIVIVLPIIHQGVKVDLRELFFDVPPQRNITRDNAGVDVDFVVYLRVDGTHRCHRARGPETTSARPGSSRPRRCAQVDRRDGAGRGPLTTRRHQRSAMQVKLDEVTNRWGVKVTAVEIREIEPPPAIAGGDDAADVRRADAARANHRVRRFARCGRSTWPRVSGRPPSLSAEGEKQAQILRAEGHREAQILEAAGLSPTALQTRSTSAAAECSTATRWVCSTSRRMSHARRTARARSGFIPMELANVARSIGERLGSLDGGGGSS